MLKTPLQVLMLKHGWALGWTIAVIFIVVNFLPVVAQQPVDMFSQYSSIWGARLVSENEGWLWLDDRLYWTDSGDRNWIDISPSISGKQRIQTIFFRDADHGWLLLADNDGVNLTLARTEDGDVNWQQRVLNIPPAGGFELPVEGYDLFFLDSQIGWLVVKYATGNNFSQGALYATLDGGLTWEQRSLPLGAPVSFVTPDLGFTAGGPRGDQFYRTTDGGRTWNLQSVQVKAKGTGLYYRLPVFVNEYEGTLPVLSMDKVGGRVTFYITQDAGQTWQLESRLQVAGEIHSAADIPLAALPGGKWAAFGIILETGVEARVAPIKVDPGLEGIVDLDMVSTNTGWARIKTGECNPQAQTDGSAPLLRCIDTDRLLRTDNGGLDWQPVQLPGPDGRELDMISRETLVPQSLGALNLPENAQQNAGWTMVLNGHGFDKCEVATLSQLQTWRSFSPYRAVNLYIGGAMRACDNVGLNASLIADLGQLGWTFIPTWVGPQASCTTYAVRMSSNATTAYNQGVSEANAAIEAVANLGLTAADKSGSVIYYDLESYDTTRVNCHNAAKAFISGWSAQMRARGNLAGVYSNGPQLNSFATIPDVPDVIWPAHWIADAYDPTATIWDVYFLSNTLWANHQRIRQYTGGHRETWGGVAMNIDSDVIDGVVSVRLPIKHYLPLFYRSAVP